MGLGAAREVAHELAAGTENNTGLRRGNQHMPHRLSGEPLLYAVSACLPEVPHPRPAGTQGAGKTCCKGTEGASWAGRWDWKPEIPVRRLLWIWRGRRSDVSSPGTVPPNLLENMQANPEWETSQHQPAGRASQLERRHPKQKAEEKVLQEAPPLLFPVEAPIDCSQKGQA